MLSAQKFTSLCFVAFASVELNSHEQYIAGGIKSLKSLKSVKFVKSAEFVGSTKSSKAYRHIHN